MKKKINVALVGSNFALKGYLPVIINNQNLNLRIICSRNIFKKNNILNLNNFILEKKWQKVFKNYIDLIICVVPPKLQEKIIKYNYKFKKKIIIVNNFNIKRDLIYVVDLVEAIIKSIYLNNNFEIINIGSGKSYSIRSIIHVIQKIYHTKISVKNRNIVRRKEILQTKLDIKKAKKILKWKPIWSLEEGLRYTIKKIGN